MAKSEGVKDVVSWMIAEIKKQELRVESSLKSVGMFGCYDDCGPSYEEDYIKQKAKLAVMVEWKISTEKYMKKLRHEEQV